MPLKLTDHARRRMVERGITEEDVAHAVSHPVGSPLPGDLGTIWVRGYGADGRILKVCRATDDPDRIITAARPD